MAGILNSQNQKLAENLIARYPKSRSALGPLLHIYQQQEGYLSNEAIAEAADSVGILEAEAMGMCSFYEMFKREPGGKYRINICNSISCHLSGSEELIESCEKTLGIQVGQTTPDKMFSLEAVECIAACSEAPCLQTNYRYHIKQNPESLEAIIEQLRTDSLKDVPPHGVLSQVFQNTPNKNSAGNISPTHDKKEPEWIKSPKLIKHNKKSSKPVGSEVLTARFENPNSHSLVEYQAAGGYEGLKKALSQTPAQVHQEIKDASLLGRGGAGFPAGVKWGFCPEGVWPRYLVVNGDESEPGTYKDRLLMEKDPHQLIEGCLIACYAVGLGQCFLYVRGEMALAAERLVGALNEAYEVGLVGKNILETNFSVDIVLHPGAGAYIVGEETALIESLEGHRGMPRLKPPRFPAADGLYSQPTIVNNVETLSNLPEIVKSGSKAFINRGTDVSAGTRMFTVSGHVINPGVFEVPFGKTTFRQLIYEFAGGLNPDRTLKAFIPGGASSPWFTEEHLDLPLEKSTIDEAGSMLGSGAVVVMDDTTDIVKACHNLVRFFAHESCGKCTPCREGTSWLEQILSRILNHRGRPSDPDLLLDVSDNISPDLLWPPKMTTICPLGPSAVAVVSSALKLFRNEFDAYIDRAPSYLEELKIVNI